MATEGVTGLTAVASACNYFLFPQEGLCCQVIISLPWFHSGTVSFGEDGSIMELKGVRHGLCILKNLA